MKKEKFKLLLIIVMIGIVLSIVGFSFAKYVSNSIWDYYLRSKGFYFYSDTLNMNTYQFADNSWDESSIYFNLRNNLNDKVVTTYDINYSVVCTIENEASSYSECKLNGTEFNTYDGVLSSVQACVNYTEDLVDVSSYNESQCDLGGYSWEYQIADSDLYFDIELTNQEYSLDYVEVKIEVESTSPYNKMLIGEYFLNTLGSSEFVYSYVNYDNYDRLTITNNSSATCLKLSWDSSELLIDNSLDEFISYYTDVNDYVNEVMFNIDEYSNLSYVFHKRDFGLSYDISDFSISESCIIAPQSFVYPNEDIEQGDTIVVDWDDTTTWGSGSSQNYRLEVSYDSDEYELVANTSTVSSYEHEVSSTATTIQYRVRSETSLDVSFWTYTDLYDLYSASFICGDTLIDSRDDEEYSTVEIGDQCWFAEDLTYNDGFSTTWTGLGVRTKSSPYDDTGMLYQFDAAMNEDTTAGSQGLCPTGWHVPTNTEWSDLFTAIGGTNQANKLKSNIYYNDGTNTSGFNAIPGGQYDINGNLSDGTTHTYWWSSSSGPYRYWIYQGWGSVATSLAGVNDGFAIRCLMDEGEPESPLVPGSFTYPNEDVGNGETITVSWGATSDWGYPSTGNNYRLEVSYDSGSYQLVANTSTVNSYNHATSLTADTIQYRVRAENSQMYSNWVYSNQYDLYYVPFTCGNLLVDSRDDKEYITVEIGDQCWFAEDLRFNDGFSTTWNGLGVRTKSSPYAATGMLYQFNAAMNQDTTPGGQGLCPTGWHVPTNTEWETLFTEIGGSNQANKLKSNIYYNDGTNTSGFNAIPGGQYDINGTLYDGTTHTFWWSSSSGPYRYWIYQGWGSVATSLASANDGFAIRCLRDS